MLTHLPKYPFGGWGVWPSHIVRDVEFSDLECRAEGSSPFKPRSSCGKAMEGKSEIPNPKSIGAVAQLGEHRLCKAGVRGSSPLGSTGFWGKPNAVFLGSSQTFRIVRGRARCCALCVLACCRKDLFAPGASREAGLGLSLWLLRRIRSGCGFAASVFIIRTLAPV